MARSRSRSSGLARNCGLAAAVALLCFGMLSFAAKPLTAEPVPVPGTRLEADLPSGMVVQPADPYQQLGVIEGSAHGFTVVILERSIDLHQQSLEAISEASISAQGYTEYRREASPDGGEVVVSYHSSFSSPARTVVRLVKSLDGIIIDAEASFHVADGEEGVNRLAEAIALLRSLRTSAAWKPPFVIADKGRAREVSTSIQSSVLTFDPAGTSSDPSYPNISIYQYPPGDTALPIDIEGMARSGFGTELPYVPKEVGPTRRRSINGRVAYETSGTVATVSDGEQFERIEIIVPRARGILLIAYTARPSTAPEFLADFQRLVAALTLPE